MSHSYCSDRVHLVFSTKNREKTISEDIQQQLWPYMAGITRNHGFEAIKVGGVEDQCACVIAFARHYAVGESHTNAESMLVEMAQRESSQRFFMAGRIRGIQRERIANRRRDQVYRNPASASRKENV